MRRKWLWGVGIAVLLVGLGWFLSQEPPLPYRFLSKFPIVERKTTRDGRRFVILKGDVDDVVREMDAELVPKSLGARKRSTNSLYRTRTLFTVDGEVTATTDFREMEQESAYISLDRNILPGYCAVIYARTPSLFDRMRDWIDGLFGRRTPPVMPRFNPPRA